MRRIIFFAAVISLLLLFPGTIALGYDPFNVPTAVLNLLLIIIAFRFRPNGGSRTMPPTTNRGTSGAVPYNPNPHNIGTSGMETSSDGEDDRNWRDPNEIDWKQWYKELDAAEAEKERREAEREAIWEAQQEKKERDEQLKQEAYEERERWKREAEEAQRRKYGWDDDE